MAVIRAFFALSIAEQLEQQLVQACDQLGARLGKTPLRWVPAENYHITLAFLGDVPSELLPLLSDITDAVAADHAPFELSLETLAWFPSANKPRQLVALLKPSAALAQLHKQLNSRLASVGLTLEKRRFRPHITLARAGRSLTAMPFEQPLAQACFEADELVLFESQLHSSGSRYSPLAVALLGEP
jgi:2'-5' RNA ligase